ncbi:MAG: DUF721 domain-containing protein [Acidobacteria bacterium]|nr:DUF721 domain-containing protein [Acidobacteriota bacterium]
MRPIQQAMPGALAALLRGVPLSEGKIGFAWRAAVGGRFDRVTSVRLEQRALIVEAATAAWAREVRRAIPVILPRMQTLLGADAVTSLSVREP